MGAGALRKEKKATPSDPGSASALSASARRRRRVLFGGEAPRKFEFLEAFSQYELAPDADDPVFARLSLDEANRFRTGVRHLCFSDGYLGDHAIERLNIDITASDKIGQRLFQIGRVEKPVKEQRSEFMTCYELLALFSVIRHGDAAELLELLFCVFDVDGDDRVGIEDFEQTILDYLSLPGMEGLVGTEFYEFKHIKSGDQKSAVRQFAELTISQYGSAEIAAPLEVGATSDQQHVVTASPAGGGFAEQPKRRKRTGCGFSVCSGKRPASDSEGSESKAGQCQDESNTSDKSESLYSSFDGARKQKIEKKELSEGDDQGTSSRQNLGNTGIDEPVARVSVKSHEADDAHAKARITVARNQPTKSSGCLPCRRSKKSYNAGAASLNFEQWRRWFVEFCELENLFDVTGAAAKSSDLLNSVAALASMQRRENVGYSTPCGVAASQMVGPVGLARHDMKRPLLASGQPFGHVASGRLHNGEENESEPELETSGPNAWGTGAQMRQPLKVDSLS